MRFNYKAENSIDLDCFIDFESKNVHLLEKKTSYYHQLPNLMSSGFQEEFIAQMNLSESLFDFKWVCYMQNGPLLTFFKTNLGLTSRDSKDLYEPFLAVTERV